MVSPLQEPPPSWRGDLSQQERISIVGVLLNVSTKLRLKRGAIAEVAEQFKCSTKTVSRLWKAAVSSLEKENALPDFGASARKLCGRKKQPSVLIERIRSIPLRRRGNMRSLAAVAGVSKLSVQRALKVGAIKRHTSAVKPLLTDSNKLERLSFCLSFVDAATYAFDAFDGRIHIDEKWFYLTRGEQNYYLAPDEEPPQRTVKSKRFISKVMFQVPVMRPIIEDGVEIFDGKLGVWPFVVAEEAKRASKNRPAGVMELKSVTVDRDEHRQMTLTYVIPAIKEKIPARFRHRELIIQQDGAPAHVKTDDPAIVAACQEGGWNIKLEKQPPNSPDLNVLDLGFFCAIQALQHEEAPEGMEELIASTRNAFKKLPSSKLDDTFLSLQQVMECTIACFGGNNYKRPHMHKDKLRHQGLLPRTCTCDEMTYLAGSAYQFLSESDN